MQQTHPFIIYNASAGSGKTHTLVKEYLKLLFSSNNPEFFKRILAITFTNKAVSEMKERIIDMLKAFSDESILTKNDSMFKSICEETNIDPLELHKKAKIILDTILHNYAAFDISTIDKFTHNIIRTFAYDLKLPLNFEVELDHEALLFEAVDSLISKAGTDDVLTNVLIDFAIEKADEDRSWDISYDFNKIAKLLTSENDAPYISTLKNKTLGDFNLLKKQIKTEIAIVEKQLVKSAETVLSLIDEAGLEHSDFSGGSRAYLPNYFLKLKNGNLDIDFSTSWIANLEEKPLYPKKTRTEDVKTILDDIKTELVSAFKLTKKAVFHLKYLQAIYKNISPLSVLKAIDNELQVLKQDQNKMLISEFNAIISNEIKNQPTPFIYERLGEKFKHYFIDEFQDTSEMQWENLLPLQRNALDSAGGSIMLVGDAKQAIYRWRGGKAEQFIDLFTKKTKPFHAEQDVKNLEKNYRSYKEIVDFNNGFFKYLSQVVFRNNDYKALYENVHQNKTIEKDGFVNLTFLDVNKEDDKNEIFPEAVLNTIKTCIKNNFNLEDICVLVRSKKEGVAIANYLSANNINIISSETLLINNSPEVVFINNIMSLLVQPENNETKIKVLSYLTTLFNINDKHEFFIRHLQLPTEKLLKSFEKYDVFVDSYALLQLPLYDLVETIVRQFKLVKTSNAYIQFYLDVVLDFTQKKGSDIVAFLDYFDKKKDDLTIISPQGQEAVQIMTVHKSKGLEFPVVIFPYVDRDIHKDYDAKEWIELDKQKYNGFTHTLLNFNNDFENFGEEGLRIFNKHKSQQELDNINILYVALTRAVEQLHVISTKDISDKGIANTKKYSGLLISYLQHLSLWNANETIYSFGNSKKSYTNSESTRKTEPQIDFISTAKEEHNIKVVTKSRLLWDTNQQEAIEKGNLIHNIMAKINTYDDIEYVINEFVDSATITTQQAISLKETIIAIIKHPQLQGCYTSNHTIYNERDIISSNGMILRPDRVIINAKNEAVIIDYKTGLEDKKHAQQLQTYQDVLEQMNIKVKRKILIYINNDILVKDV
jgi:ATP-dependent exoDNAse (exonuclease V) beta subunit